jgi:hypothetical protein
MNAGQPSCAAAIAVKHSPTSGAWAVTLATVPGSALPPWQAATPVTAVGGRDSVSATTLLCWYLQCAGHLIYTRPHKRAAGTAWPSRGLKSG